MIITAFSRLMYVVFYKLICVIVNPVPEHLIYPVRQSKSLLLRVELSISIVKKEKSGPANVMAAKG